MPLPADVEDAAARLTGIYTTALDRIRAELSSIGEETSRAALRRRLRDTANHLEAMLREASQQAEMWVDHDLPRVYERGLGDFVTQTAAIGAVSTDDVLLDFNMPSRPAVERLAAGLTDDLLSATRYVSTQAKRQVREAVRSGSLAKVLEGRSLREATGDVQRELERIGLGTVRYANGARVPLDVYASMAVRTATAQAYNGGMFDAGQANGVEFYECFDSAECGLRYHEDPEKANGRIYAAEVMAANLISHNNCVRSWGARPDVTNAEQAVGAEPLGGVVDVPARPEPVPLRPRRPRRSRARSRAQQG